MPTRRSVFSGLLSAAATSTVLPAILGVARPAAAQGRPAPEFAGIDGWLNSDAPLTLAALRGKVVLVDFWTYSCINCRRTVPYLNRWQSTYGAHGLQVVGIHTPEFGFERMRRNVEDSVRSFGIRYPVGQDNGFATWRAWGNRAWPSFYLLDRNGRIVLVREGEGHARELESAIRALLGLPRSDATAHAGDDPDLSRIGTAEIYFGSGYPSQQDRAQAPRAGLATYGFGMNDPERGAYQLDQDWERQPETLVLRSARGGLRVRFRAAKLHVVAAAPVPVNLRVTANGGAPQVVVVNGPTLYTLLDGETYGEQVLTVEADAPGLTLYSMTFG